MIGQTDWEKWEKKAADAAKKAANAALGTQKNESMGLLLPILVGLIWIAFEKR